MRTVNIPITASATIAVKVQEVFVHASVVYVRMTVVLCRPICTCGCGICICGCGFEALWQNLSPLSAKRLTIVFQRISAK